MRPTYRKQDHHTVEALRYILVPLLREMQNGLCAYCQKPRRRMDIDHKKYGPHVTIYDLQLLCRTCHKKKHPNIHVLQPQ